MFICDVLAAVCSGAALIFAGINFKFIARLPAMIADTSMSVADRNVKLLLFITMLIVIAIVLVKFVVSVCKILYRVLVVNKLPENSENSGLLANLFAKSTNKAYRIFTVCLNSTVALYVGAMILLVAPNKSHVVGTGRTERIINADANALWEINWFLPMMCTILVLLAVGLVIDIARLKIIHVIREYEEIYALGQERVIVTQKCGACGFENHPTTRICADCGGKLGGWDVKKAMMAKTVGNNLNV